jgi:hypothetical protein
MLSEVPQKISQQEYVIIPFHCHLAMTPVSPEIFLLLLWVMSQNGVLPNDSNGRHGEIDIPELKNKRTQRSMALLDALAAICINKPKKQVVAVSLSLTTDGSILCIAANDGVESAIPSHLSGIFSQLKDIRSSLQSPLQEGNNETNTPQPDKGPTTQALEINLLCDIFTFSKSKFRQCLIKRRDRFKDEVIPSMHAYATERRSAWTREEAQDYQKFEDLLTLFGWCFRWADLSSAKNIIEPMAKEVTASANEWREMIADEGDTSRLTCWEREIGQSLGTYFETD